MKISDFQVLSGVIEKYKPALSILAFSWNNLYSSWNPKSVKLNLYVDYLAISPAISCSPIL